MFRPLNPFALKEKLPTRGNWLTRGIGRTVLRLGGWQFQGKIPNVSKAVLIAAPHTSTWDFPIGMAAILGVGVNVQWLGKAELVNGRFRRFFHFLGGIPVDRRSTNGVVAQIAEQFRSRPYFLLALAPEGTRKPVERWKLGFYHIAQAADVPIVPVSLDYGRKWIEVGLPINPQDDRDTVSQKVADFYEGVLGRNHHKAALSLNQIKGN
ncbi:MAG: 1-acyl-sn-glycerol-3-phosphate acyltransferase [Chloroflexota bacterium]